MWISLSLLFILLIFPSCILKLFLGEYTLDCYVSLSADLLIIIPCSSLFLVIFLVLKCTLSDIHRVTPPFFLVSIFMVHLFPSLYYYLPTALYLKVCLVENISLDLIFKIYSDNNCFLNSVISLLRHVYAMMCLDLGGPFWFF